MNKSAVPEAPTASQVQESITRYASDRRTALPEKALTLLFKSFPTNTDIAHVLPKVATLNALYSTNIYAVTDVAEHIIKANIDSLLASDSPQAVEKIELVSISGRSRSIYSFATKYCSWHRPDSLPIFDRFVAERLVAYQRKDAFASFAAADLRKYQTFISVLKQFQIHYHLEEFSLRDLDKFLWQEGRSVA